MATNLDTEYLEYTEAERLATKAYFDNLEVVLAGDGMVDERDPHGLFCVGCPVCEAELG